MFDQFTLGIEEEFQIVDPTTREQKSHVSEILEEGKLLLGEKIKPEMIQSMVEVGTGVCANIQEAREDITKLRCIISGLAKKKGLVIVAASTHPFSKWSEQEIYDGDRYKLLVDELQMVARSLLMRARKGPGVVLDIGNSPIAGRVAGGAAVLGHLARELLAVRVLVAVGAGLFGDLPV